MSKILKFNDLNNIEFRRGSKDYGTLLNRILEFIRIYKKESDDSIKFNIPKFEIESNIKISEIKKLIEENNNNNKSLFAFDIIIDGDNILFKNLSNKKSIHNESRISNHVRKNYEIFGVDDFYKKFGDEYTNPHLKDIDKCVEYVIDKKITLQCVLDLACGSGEITNLLKDKGEGTHLIQGCDPFMYNQYENNTNERCFKYSFEDIQKGVLNSEKYDAIFCSYALHLCNKSILPDVLWNMSYISDKLIIISPTKNPIINEENGWILEDDFIYNKSKCRIFTSKNK